LHRRRLRSNEHLVKRPRLTLATDLSRSWLTSVRRSLVELQLFACKTRKCFARLRKKFPARKVRM